MPRLSRHSQALTADQFAAAELRFPRMPAATVEAARAVLVDGERIEDAAKKHGLTKQWLFQVISDLHPVKLPAGWVRRSVTLPPELMAQVLELERQALSALTDSQSDGTNK